tara:strand:+ start:9700 stop:10275 length:576 start_codon:yes stop_codon:yes gene_type:complete
MVAKILKLFLFFSLLQFLRPAEASYGPTAAYKWFEAPNVVVCKFAPVDAARVRRALSVWKRLGYSFGSVVYNDESSRCIGEDYKGFIVIDLIGQDFIEPNLAMTRVYYDKRWSRIIGAKIQIKQTSAERDRVLEHEIGHALGWKHFSRRYHLMNPKWETGGWDTFGLTFKVLQRKIAASEQGEIGIIEYVE